MLSVALSTQAASTSATVASGVMTNFSALLPGSARVTQIIVSASTTNTTSLQFVDTSTNSTVYTNSSYVGAGSYLTNLVTTWTNYYGVTNSVTNIQLVDYSITNAATTNFYNVPVAVQVNTNATVKFDLVNYYFNRGVWVTNLGGGPAIITLTYVQ